jgi:hypothetical protein
VKRIFVKNNLGKREGSGDVLDVKGLGIMRQLNKINGCEYFICDYIVKL